MNCPKCGMINKDDAAFCGQCGEKLNTPVNNMTMNNQSTMNQQMAQPTTNQQMAQLQNVTITPQQQNLDPSMKKFATLSVVIPSIGLFFCLFIGFIPVLAWALGGMSVGFAKKGKAADPKLAKVGMVLSYIFIAMGFVLFFMALSGD